MHVNKAHAALLIASAGALTGGTQKKPFPKLRPLKSALAAKPDIFGVAEEDALLRSKREGQDSFRGAFEKAALLQADVFGTFRRRQATSFECSDLGAQGFSTRRGDSCRISRDSPDLTVRLAQVSRTRPASSPTWPRAPASRTTCPC